MTKEDALDYLNDVCNELIKKHENEFQDKSFWETEDGRMIEAIEVVCANTD